MPTVFTRAEQELLDEAHRLALGGHPLVVRWSGADAYWAAQKLESRGLAEITDYRTARPRIRGPAQFRPSGQIKFAPWALEV